MGLLSDEESTDRLTRCALRLSASSTSPVRWSSCPSDAGDLGITHTISHENYTMHIKPKAERASFFWEAVSRHGSRRAVCRCPP